MKLSRLLSWVLRHKPEAIGIELDLAGWVDVDKLLAGLERYGKPTTYAELASCVESNKKKRFTLSPDATRIRAAQGHSVHVDLGLTACDPPAQLYHGTSQRFIAAILEEGLIRGNRHDVHLSTSIATASQVGSRCGRPVILSVDSKAMHRDGYPFFCSDNGVWLTRVVPPDYITAVQNSNT